MLLTFRPEFIASIEDGSKIHTIRSDAANRIKEGARLHIWCGNPRNPTKHPYFVGLKHAVSIQDFEIRHDGACRLFVDGKVLNEITCKQLANNDGFETLSDFLDYFNREDFRGKLIHFTSLKY